MTEKYLVQSEISDNEVSGLGTYYLYILNKSPFIVWLFFTPKIGVLHGLLQGINSPCSSKFSMMGFNPSLTSGFSGYYFLGGNKCGSLSLTTTGIAFCAWPTDFPSAHTLGFTFCSIKGRKRESSIFIKADMELAQYISPQKRWGRLWYNQKLVQK